jgi:hypothetical protein
LWPRLTVVPTIPTRSARNGGYGSSRPAYPASASTIFAMPMPAIFLLPAFTRVGITLDLYSHVVEGLQENAVALVDDAMAKALQKRATELG